MRAERIRILYFAHYFPPLGGVAALRSLKMVKYLAEIGIDCVVLCAKPWGLREPKDFSLIPEIPVGTDLRRYFAPDISWLYKLLWGLRLNRLVDRIAQDLLSPDAMLLALPFAWLKLKSILGKEPLPALLIISGGPFSMLRLAPRAKAEYGIPYICDWRDEWTNNAQRINRDYPPRVQARECRQEAMVLAGAAACVYLTAMMRDSFIKTHPQVSDKPFRIIPNGYDEADFRFFKSLDHRHGKLRIVYTGSFYDRIQPDRLWQAITELVAEGMLDSSLLELVIIGRNNPEFVLGAYQNDGLISGIVRFEAFKPHQDAIVELQNADLLLIYIPSGENSASILTGKLFDYLRSGKAILTIAPPDGLAAKIVTEAGCGYVADFDNILSIKAQLQSVYTAWKAGSLSGLKLNHDYIRQFSRQEQARNLSELIKGILDA